MSTKQFGIALCAGASLLLAIALNPVYWIGTALLVFWCAGQLFDRRPARHSVGAVVLYFLIAVMIGAFAVQELLGA